jgi:hypothetical protein
MDERKKKINGILKFAEGRKVEKRWMKFFDENGNLIPDMSKEINCPFDVVIQFVDFSKKRVHKVHT